MKLWEIGLAVGLFAAALYYLYRKFIVSKGCMCGNAGECSQNQKMINSMAENNGEGCCGCNYSRKS